MTGLAERQRRELLGSRRLAVGGRWETVDGIHPLIAQRLENISHLLGGLAPTLRDFR